MRRREGVIERKCSCRESQDKRRKKSQAIVMNAILSDILAQESWNDVFFYYSFTRLRYSVLKTGLIRFFKLKIIPYLIRNWLKKFKPLKFQILYYKNRKRKNHTLTFTSQWDPIYLSQQANRVKYCRWSNQNSTQCHIQLQVHTHINCFSPPQSAQLGYMSFTSTQGWQDFFKPDFSQKLISFRTTLLKTTNRLELIIDIISD